MNKLNIRIVPIMAVLAIVAAFVWAFVPQPVEVQVSEVTRGAFQQTIEEDGKTRVRERYNISAPLSGKLQRISLKAGDIVKQNQVVAFIAPSAPALLDIRSEQELSERVGTAEAQQARSNAEVERAQASLEKSANDLARFKKLAADKFISQSQLDQTELEVKINSRALEAAKYARHAAEHELAVTRTARQQFQCEGDCGSSKREWPVRSPVAGRVLKIVQENEGIVVQGQPLLEIGNPADLEVVVDVLSTDAVQIHPGAAVQIKGSGLSSNLQGHVRRVEPSAHTKISALGVEEQRVNIIIDFNSTPEQWNSLGDGFSVDTKIIIFNTDKAIKVPVSALFRKGNLWAVFVVSNNKAEERTISIARRSSTEAMVEKGLQPGEKVIIYPSEKIKHKERVKTQPAASNSQ